MENIPRVKVTDAAKKVIAELRAKNGKLMFHQSGGCCDGSSPMCYADGEFLVGRSDVWLGEIDDCDFFMAKDQFEFWKHTELTIDVTPGRGVFTRNSASASIVERVRSTKLLYYILITFSAHRQIAWCQSPIGDQLG